MTVSINPDGTWRVRPQLGAAYLGPNGIVEEVAVTLPDGCVFVGLSGAHIERDAHGRETVVSDGPIVVSAQDLLTRYKPRCAECGAFHEPEYPHQLTGAYQRHIQQAHGRAACVADTYTHCTGILRAAVESATQEGAVA